MDDRKKTRMQLIQELNELQSRVEEMECSRADEDLRENAERFINLFETMVQGVVYQNADGAIISANPAAERILGLTLDQMQGRTSMDPRWRAIREDGSEIPGDNHPSMIALRTGVTVKDAVMGVFNPEKEDYTWIRITAVPQFRSGETSPWQVCTTFEDITERIRADKTIRLKDELLQMTGEVAKVGGWEFDAVTGQGTWTDEVARIHDLDPSKETNVTLGLRFYSGASRKKIERAVKDAVEKAKPYNLELPMVSARGTAKWVRTIGFPVLEGNRVVKVRGIYQDITEQKNAETSLRESEERYRSLFENMQEGFSYCRMIYDELDRPDDFIFLAVNQMFTRLIRFDNVVGRKVTEIIPGVKELNPEVFFVYDRVIRTGQPEKFEVEFKPLNIWLSISVYRTGKNHFVAVFDNITERKQAEEALREKEHHYRTLFESMVQGVVYQGANEDILSANPAAERIIGLKLDQMLRRSSITEKLRIIHEDGTEFSREDRPAIRAMRTGEKILNVTMGIFNPPKKAYTWVKVNSVPQYRSGENVPYQVFTTFEDITEQKRAEEALQKTSAELQSILDNMINAFIIWKMVFDDKGQCISFRFGYFNDSYAKVAHVTREEAEGKDVFEVWPDSERSWVDVYGEVAITGQSRTFEMYHVSTHGTYHCNAFRPWNTPEYVGVIFEDITERKQAEEALQKSEALLNEVGRIAKIGGWEMDVRGHKSTWTRGTYDICEIDPNETPPGPGEHIDYYLPEYRPMVAEAIRALVEEDKPLYFEARAQTAKGNVIWVRTLGRAIRENGVCVKVYGTLQDITERKEAEEALQKSEALLNDVSRIAKIGGWEMDASNNTFTWTRSTYDIIEADPLESPPGLEGHVNYYFPEYRPMVAEAMRALVEENKPMVFEARARTCKGNDIWISTLGRAIRQNGVCIKVYGTLQDITERRQAGNALRESEKKYRLLAENVRDVIWTLDDNLHYTYVSPSSRHISGRTPEELVGKTVLEYMPPESVQIVRNVYNERLQAESRGKMDTVSRFEHQLICKNGSLIWVEAQAQPIFDTDGKRIGLMGVSRDITKRKQAEDALRESEKKYRLLAENVRDVIWILDNAFQFTYVSPSARYMTGYESEEYVGKIFNDFTPPESTRIIRKTFNERIEAESQGRMDTVSRFEYQMICKDGSLIWVETQAQSILDKDGKRIGLMGVSRDITKRKQAEDALRESEKKYRLLAENVRDVIWTLDNDFRHAYVSPSVRYVTGYKPEELVGKTVLELIPPESVRIIRTVFNERIEAESRGRMDIVSRFEYQMICKDGSLIWVEAQAQPILDAAGKRIGFTGVSRDITARKKAEEELRESEKRYRLLAENIRDVIWTTDNDLRFTYISPSFRYLEGYEPEDVLGKTIFDFTPPESFQIIHDLTAERLHAESQGKMDTVSRFEFQQRCKDGSLIWVEVQAQSIFDEAGARIGLIGMSRDITKRKRTEAALHESETRFRSLFDTMTEGVALHEVVRDETGNMVDYRIIDVNPAYERQTGLSANEVRGGLASKIYKTGSSPYLDIFMKMAENGTPYAFETYFPPLGKHFRIYVFSPGEDMFATVFEDITERKNSERLLLHHELQYHTILTATMDGFALIDDNGIYLDVNDRFCEMLGYTREELCCNSIYNVSLIDTEQTHRAHAALIRERGFDRYESRHKRKDGTIIDTEVSINYIPSENNYIAFYRDITEKKKLEEQFRQSQKMESVGRLAGGVAHDFNNILTAIIGNVELSRMTLSPSDPIYPDIVEIGKSAERAANLTRQLLAFSRKQIISPKVLNLNEIILEMDKMLRRIIGEHIEYRTLTYPELHSVSMDLGQVEQVLTNLVVNSRDAMPQGGKLTIETANVYLDEEFTRTHPDTTPGDYVMMAVSDTGVGMDKNVLIHLFEPFFTTKPRGSGTGLGLSTCYGIVKQNRGSISVYSEPGYGTTMKVFLPAIMENAIRKPLEGEKIPAYLGSETILVVEDEPAVRSMIVRVLEERGYTILTAGNGAEAMEIDELHSGTFDALITDIIMPRMGGKELSEKIKARHPDIRVLFMSGYTDDSIVHHGILDPGVEFMQKPFSPLALAKKVRAMLDE